MNNFENYEIVESCMLSGKKSFLPIEVGILLLIIDKNNWANCVFYFFLIEV